MYVKKLMLNQFTTLVESNSEPLGTLAIVITVSLIAVGLYLQYALIKGFKE